LRLGDEPLDLFEVGAQKPTRRSDAEGIVDVDARALGFGSASRDQGNEVRKATGVDGSPDAVAAKPGLEGEGGQPQGHGIPERDVSAGGGEPQSRGACERDR
jgi:hypothetical protein